jgi:hypothetical protein
VLFKEVILVHTENHTKHINTKCRGTDCWSNWYIQLPFGLKGLMMWDFLRCGFLPGTATRVASGPITFCSSYQPSRSSATSNTSQIIYWVLHVDTTSYQAHKLTAPKVKLSSGFWGPFFREQTDLSVKLTAHLHLAPRLRMRRAIPPCPHTSSCRGS